MTEVNSKPDTGSPVETIFSSKSAPTPRFSAAERVAIAKHHRALADQQWVESQGVREEALVHDIALLHATQDDGSIHKALRLRRPAYSPIIEQAGRQSARQFPGDEGAIGCDTHLTSPPYSTGDPLTEEVGSSAMVIGGEVPELSNLKTFSQLALPDEGLLSLGVGLGKVQINPNVQTLHPPAMEVPQTFPVRGGILEITNTRASLGYYFACLPGAPLQVEKRLTVTADVSVGEQSQPFFVVMPSVSAAPILQAFGVAHLVVSGPGAVEAQSQVRFLEHRENGLVVFGTPIVMREFSVSRNLTLRPGTSWVYVGIEVRLEVHRWFLAPPVPDLARRDGFVLIDLRSARHNTHGIHPILAPGGPVKVTSIRMTFCRPDPVLA